MAILSATSLCQRYSVEAETIVALDGVDFSVNAGEFVAVMGPSGSGKSTLLALLAGIERPVSGDVRLDGQSFSTLSDTARAILRRRQFGFVFQTFNLIPNLTLSENVALPFHLDGAPRETWEPRVRQALVSVGLAHRENHLPDRVSMGERQRAAVARALVTEPKLVFADEPTGSLDLQRGDDVLELLRQARDQSGRTIVMVTHDPRAAAVADRIVRLKDGRIVAEA
jgi:putative ABC transport system ATP-binding protein